METFNSIEESSFREVVGMRALLEQGQRRAGREIFEIQGTHSFFKEFCGFVVCFFIQKESIKMIIGREVDQERLLGCFTLRWRKQQHFCMLVEKLQRKKKKKMKKRKEKKQGRKNELLDSPMGGMRSDAEVCMSGWVGGQVHTLPCKMLNLVLSTKKSPKGTDTKPLTVN